VSPFASKTPCRGCHRPIHGSFCEDCRSRGAARETKPEWHRLYDARWQRASKAWLAANPVAVDWFGDHGGRVYRAEVVDHITPHRGNLELFWDQDNWQGLTKHDHDRKTAYENSCSGRWVNVGTDNRCIMRWVGMGVAITGDLGR
jgi:5-methylcytosine-specific restriction enzyme A